MKEMGQKEFSEKLELAKGLEESILRFPMSETRRI